MESQILIGQYWFRYWLVTWQHQVITCTNVDSSSVGSCPIHINAITLMLIGVITKMHLKITHSKSMQHPPGNNNEFSTFCLSWGSMSGNDKRLEMHTQDFLKQLNINGCIWNQTITGLNDKQVFWQFTRQLSHNRAGKEVGYIANLSSEYSRQVK